MGFDGVILHLFNGGANWIPQVSGTDHLLAAVSFADALNGWVAREVVPRTTDGGANWNTVIGDTIPYLKDVHTVSTNRCYAVGAAELALRRRE